MDSCIVDPNCMDLLSFTGHLAFIYLYFFKLNCLVLQLNPPKTRKHVTHVMLLENRILRNHVFSEIDSHLQQDLPNRSARLLQQLLGYIPWSHQKVQGVAKDPSDKTTSASWEVTNAMKVCGVRRFVRKILGIFPHPRTLLPYHSYKNPLKYGNSMGVVWECRSHYWGVLRKSLVKLTKTPLKSRASKTIIVSGR